MAGTILHCIVALLLHRRRLSDGGYCHLASIAGTQRCTQQNESEMLQILCIIPEQRHTTSTNKRERWSGYKTDVLGWLYFFNNWKKSTCDVSLLQQVWTGFELQQLVQWHWPQCWDFNMCPVLWNYNSRHFQSNAYQLESNISFCAGKVERLYSCQW